MRPVRPEPGAPQSRVRHSTTEPLRSICDDINIIKQNLTEYTVPDSKDLLISHGVLIIAPGTDWNCLHLQIWSNF